MIFFVTLRDGTIKHVSQLTKEETAELRKDAIKNSMKVYNSKVNKWLKRRGII